MVDKTSPWFVPVAFAALVLFAPPDAAIAATTAVSLPNYDCASNDGRPSRVLSQVIDGTMYQWREYLARTSDGAPDQIAPPLCLIRLKPAEATLSRSAAEALISRGLGVGLPTAAFQSPNPSRDRAVAPDDPDMIVPAMPLNRRDRSVPFNPTIPNPLGPKDGLERVLKSSPLGLGNGLSGFGQAAAVIANDSRVKVADTTVFPNSTVVYLVSRFATSGGRCSGVLVSQYVAMTAGHCVQNSSNGGFATATTIAPGQYSNNGQTFQPYGTISAQAVATTLAWPTFSGPASQEVTNYKHDLATVRLSTPAAFTATFMPIAFDDPSTTAISAGYPAQDPTGTSSSTQWTATGAQSSDSVNYGFRRMGLAEYAIAVSPGNSGGPYWRQDTLGRRMLIGITSYGDDTTGVSGGPYYSAFNQDLVTSWLTWTPTNPVPDPVIATNTAFAKSIVISGESGTITGSNAGAAIETGAPKADSVGGQRLAWWQWTAPRTGYVTIDTIGSNFDTALGVYVGRQVSTLYTIAANDDIDSGIVQTSRVTFLANAGTTYQLGVDGFHGDQGRITLNWAMAAQVPPVTGWYYVTPNGGGRGFAVEAHPSATNGKLFFAAYQYDAAGAAVWQIASLSQAAGNPDASGNWTYTGSLNQTALNSAGAVTTASLGSVKLVVPKNGGALTLTWPSSQGGANLTLTRFPIDSKAVVSPASAIVEQTGWWYAPSQAGRGMMVECQNAQCFIGYFTYRTDGTPVWYVAIGQASTDGASFDGNLIEVAGGPGFTTAGTTLKSTDRGTISLRFSGPDAGTMQLAGGTPVAITRFSVF
jgi:V8-like Glu-specific endopeptidase